MRNIRNDCIQPIIISGHQFNSLSQHQAATADYLEAYKIQPDNPLINLCVGNYINFNYYCCTKKSIFRMLTELLFVKSSNNLNFFFVVATL